MSFTEAEAKHVESVTVAFIEQVRPPEKLRSKVDISYRLQEQSVDLFEVRPHWQDPSRRTETPIVKTTYVRKQGIWKIYWQRANLKWYLYEPKAGVKSLEEVFAIVKADEYGCFWG